MPPHPSPPPIRRSRMSLPAPEVPLSLSLLPADIQTEILSRVGDAVSVVRCAATCKAWRCLIKEPSFLSLLSRHRRVRGFDASALLGFFFRDASQSLPRRRLYRRRPTCFLLLGNSRQQPSAPTVLPLSHFLTTVGDLDSFAPVAFGGGGLVALCRFPCTSNQSVRICIFNPLAGTFTLLPPLPPYDFPEKIVFLEADNSSFRLLAVMNGQGTLSMRVFSSPPSENGDWETLVSPEIPLDMVLHIGSPAVVHHGAVHWICGTLTLPLAVHAVAVRLTDAGTSLSRFELPPRAGVHCLLAASTAMRLFSSAQGTLSLLLVDELVLSIWYLDDYNADIKRWSCRKAVYLMPMLPQIVSGRQVKLSIQGLCERSGFLFFQVEGEGLFKLNLEEKKLVKVCKNNFTQNLCPYVTDFASFLEAMKSF